MRFQKEEHELKNIIETKLIRAAEIAVNQELTEEEKKKGYRRTENDSNYV